MHADYDEAIDFITVYPRLNGFIRKLVIRLRYRDLSPAEVKAVLMIKREYFRRAQAS